MAPSLSKVASYLSQRPPFGILQDEKKESYMINKKI